MENWFMVPKVSTVSSVSVHKTNHSTKDVHYSFNVSFNRQFITKFSTSETCYGCFIYFVSVINTIDIFGKRGMEAFKRIQKLLTIRKIP